MRAIPLIITLALVPAACTDRPLDGSTESTSSSGSTGSPGSTGSTATTASPTTGPITTSTGTTPGTTTGSTGPVDTTTTSSTGPVDTTTTSTTDPIDTTTSATSSTTSTNDGTTAPGTTSTTSGPPDPPPDRTPPPGLVGCTVTAPPGTLVSGDTQFGPFVGDRAYFGILTANVPGPLSPSFLFLSKEADAATELDQLSGESGAILFEHANTDPFNDGEGWIGTWPYFGQLIFQNQVDFPGGLTVTIESLAGNWDVPDPDDPPRVLGTLNGKISGPFDAVYCNKVDIFILVE